MEPLETRPAGDILPIASLLAEVGELKNRNSDLEEAFRKLRRHLQASAPCLSSKLCLELNAILASVGH